jgi:hypothetical protein
MTVTIHIPGSNRLKTFRNGLEAFPDNFSMTCVKRLIIPLFGPLAC